MKQDIRTEIDRIYLNSNLDNHQENEMWHFFSSPKPGYEEASIEGGTISFSKQVSNGHMSVHETWRSGERVCYVTVTVGDRVSTIIVPEEWTSEDLWYTLNNHESVLDGVEWLKHASTDELKRIHLMSKLK